MPKLSENFIVKALVSALVAVAMYWMYIPQPIILLLVMMGIDLFMGSVAAALETPNAFKIREFGKGILRKASTFPMLAACHLAEDPLHLHFDLDVYVALALICYEFLSVVESYARIGGPVPRILIMAAERAKFMLATEPKVFKQVESTTKTIEVQPTEARPEPPPPVTITTVKETHVEAVKVDPQP